LSRFLFMGVTIHDFERSDDIREIARANEVGAADALLRTVARRRDKERGISEGRTGIPHGERENDLGFIRALNWVLSLPAEAGSIIEQAEK